ncbi:hypothetical protein [Streptomyces sp. GC420]|uniref:hypothetical protein n=1 Tax=Streptomyces sp. GC420 TaxID=2697568 RepID=UPI001414DF15|nr:hypothetical protein [Streptomyces sp. GC420]NBM19165.1 hypothetical protein [Streptomyces sp. GC420]
MPIAIAVTSAGLVLPGPDRTTPLAAVLKPPGEQSLERAVADLHMLVEQHGYVVALLPSNLPRAYVQRLHTARAVLESDRIALLGPGLPPLGVARLALQLRQLSVCDFSPGVIASAARLLAHYIYAGAVLGSVARLDRVPVTLKSHAKSWVPGSQFAVLANPEAHLVKISGAAPETRTVLPGPQFATTLTVAHGQMQAEWVTATLAPAWRIQGLQEVTLPEGSADWWGTGKLIEFAAAIPDISVLYQLVASVRREECRWCGLELIGDRCGFCSSPVSPPDERPGRTAGVLVRRTP